MIDSTVDGGLRVLTLDRPDRRNALTWDALADLQASIDAATEAVIVLTGAGPAFCAGADLDTVAELDAVTAREFAREGQTVARQLEAYDGVVVAAIDGPARGGGLELALACDIRVCTPESTFAESGVEHGLFGAWGGTIRLPDVVGLGPAMDLSLSGRVIDAEEARQMGLVSQITGDPRSIARDLLENDARAMRTIKCRLRDTADRRSRERAEAEAFADLISRMEF